jgi:hypothetical protein
VLKFDLSTELMVLLGKRNRKVRGKRLFFYRRMGLVCESYNSAIQSCKGEVFTTGKA